MNLNITLDDSNPLIEYAPPGEWSELTGNPFDFGGAHMLTVSQNGTASFNFTGIAIYFLSPLWPYSLSTSISLDSAPHILVNLTDPSSPTKFGGAETVPSQVVWGATGLANTQHNLLISFGIQAGVVDALMYTIDAATNVSSSLSSSSFISSTSTFQATITVSSTANPNLASSPKSKSQSALVIALGSLVGILGLLVILCTLGYVLRCRKSTLQPSTIGHGPIMSSIWPNSINNNRNTDTEGLTPELGAGRDPVENLPGSYQSTAPESLNVTFPSS